MKSWEKSVPPYHRTPHSCVTRAKLPHETEWLSQWCIWRQLRMTWRVWWQVPLLGQEGRCQVGNLDSSAETNPGNLCDKSFSDHISMGQTFFWKNIYHWYKVKKSPYSSSQTSHVGTGYLRCPHSWLLLCYPGRPTDAITAWIHVLLAYQRLPKQLILRHNR